MKHTFIPFVLAMAMFSESAEAKVKLPNYYTSNMVVQQNSTLKIHGTAKAGKKVTLTASWTEDKVITKADKNGQFELQVSTPKAGGPYTMTFSDGQETKLENVMSGEVWLGGGQSNMEMPLAGWGKILNYKEEIEKANYPQIRLLQVKKHLALTPQDETDLNMGGWQECSPQTVDNFSSLCYFYAVRLWEELKVPIGVIDDNWGGTPCEAWMSAEALRGVTGFEKKLEEIEGIVSSGKTLTDIEQEKDAGTAPDHAPWYTVGTDDSQWQTMIVPTIFEKTALGNFDGVVWMRRTIDVPRDWAGQKLTINLGNVDDEDDTYWNGMKVGQTRSYSDIAHYTIPAKSVKAGRAEICVRVKDTGGNGGIGSAKEELYLQNAKGEKLTLAGEWKYAIGVAVKDLPSINKKTASVLYNAMIRPLFDFPVKGVIWYQGCDNVGRAAQHEALFQTLITEWRQRWDNPQMPFYFVQLANYLQPSELQPNSEWAKLRESQASALCLPHTGMAVNIDLGTANDIHPKTKRELGRRLAAVALHNTYNKKGTAYTAPIYESYEVKGKDIILHFSTPEGSEPLVQEADLNGFIMAGNDRKWHVATARTNGSNEVIVSCPEVSVPLAVRYGWADNPTCTLRTQSNLHVAPFRTDKW